MRRGRRDHVDGASELVERVVALGQQRLVRGRRPLLRAPEERGVRLVPDDDIVHVLRARKRVDDERAVRRARVGRNRRRGRVAEDREDDALPELRSSLRPAHVGARLFVELGLAGLPAQRDPNRLEPDGLLVEHDGLRVLRPFEVVVGDAEDQPRPGRSRTAAGEEEQENRERQPHRGPSRFSGAPREIQGWLRKPGPAPSASPTGHRKRGSRGNHRFPRVEIGVPRFELGTSPTRTERATRLRHTPSRRMVAIPATARIGPGAGRSRALCARPVSLIILS